MKLRGYQKDFINDSIKYFKNNDKGIAQLACGSGKSVIAIVLAEQLLKRKMIKGQVLVIVPTKLLVKQFEKEIIKIVDDDVVIEKIFSGEPRLSLSTPARYVITTYRSAVLHIYNTERKFALIIFDEAHHLAGKEKSLTRLMKLPSQKKLFMTATKKVLRWWKDFKKKSGEAPSTQKIVKLGDAQSMDDDEQFGNVFFKYLFNDAIGEKYLSPYKITIDNKIAYDMSHAARYTTNAKKILLKYVRKYNAKRILVFFNSIAMSENFESEFDDDEDNGVIVRHVDSKMKNKDRQAIIEWFRGDHDSRINGGDHEGAKVISNVNLFSEGVDIPIIDMILFGERKLSVIDIIQKIGRGLRICERKTILNIIIPRGSNKKKDIVTEKFIKKVKNFAIIGENDIVYNYG